MKHPSAHHKHRFFSLLRWVIAVLCIITGRLIYLQIAQSHFFTHKSQKNFLRYEKTPSLRGNIVDKNGNLLATNRQVISLYWQGLSAKDLSKEHLATLSLLEIILETTLDISLIKTAERQAKTLLLKEDISFEELSKIIEQLPTNHSIKIQTSFKRFYPHNDLACHILGYLGTMQNEMCGKMGLESLLDESLKGTPGQIEHTVNSRGKKLTEKELSAALSGQTIQTTLHMQLQKIAEDVFPADHNGAILGLNPRTGDLVIVVSRPAFDPNIFLSPLSEQDWNQLQDKKPFINRAFKSCYPPASLFKLVTAAAALENGIVTPESTSYCRGHIDFCGRPYHCHKLIGHGHLNFREAIAHSCNIPFYDIGKQVKIDLLAEYAHKFKLGEKTGLLLPEKIGLVPTSKWKRETKGEPFWPGERLSAAIGQSYLLITPLQATRLMGAICEGYLVKPRILTEEPIERIPLDIKESTLEVLREGSRMVVKQGTGSRLKKLADVTIHAKTGTAQTSDLSKRNDGKEFLEHAWLIAHTQYKQEEPLVLAIFIENAGSSKVATGVAIQFLLKYCEEFDKN